MRLHLQAGDSLLRPYFIAGHVARGLDIMEVGSLSGQARRAEAKR